MQASAEEKKQAAAVKQQAQQQAQLQAKQYIEAAKVAADNLAAKGPAELAILRKHMAKNPVLNAVSQKIRLKGNRKIVYEDRLLTGVEAAEAAKAWWAIPNQFYFNNFHIPGGILEFASKWRAGQIEINLVLGCSFNNEQILIHLLPTKELEKQMRQYHRNTVEPTDSTPRPLSTHV